MNFDLAYTFVIRVYWPCPALTEQKLFSGTPIQNNLTELWSLLNWLNEPNYGSNRNMFKHQVLI